MKMKPKPLTCFAAVIPGRRAPFILSWSARQHAKFVRACVGEQYAWDRESIEVGWERAKANGVSIIKVRIEPES